MIESLKDLSALLKLCRKQGVTELSLGSEVSFKLGELPQRQETEMTEEAQMAEAYEEMPDRILTPEELTFLANGGLPKDLEEQLQ